MKHLIFHTSNNSYLFNPQNGHIYLYDTKGGSINWIENNQNIVSKILPANSLSEVKNEISKNLKQMSLCVTQDCNLRCRYCVYSGQFKNYRKHSSKSMFENIAMDAVDYFLSHISPEENKLYFTYYGGEPFLNFPIIFKTQQYLKRVLKDRIHFSITTNGTLLNNEIIEFVVKNMIYLTISLDGDEVTHNRNRVFSNGEGSFKFVDRNIEALKKAYGNLFDLYVNFSVTLSANCDYKELDLFFSKYKNNIKVSGVMFYGSQSIETVAGNSKNLSFLVDKYIDGCLKHFFNDDLKKNAYKFSSNVIGRGIRNIHLRRISDSSLFGSHYKLEKHCIPGSTKIFVAPDGDLFPCEKLDSYSHLKLGNIYIGINAELTYRYIEEYTALRDKYCKDCFLIDICDQCFQNASDGQQWNQEKMTYYCSIAREEYTKAFSIYAQILEKDINAFDFLDI